MKDWNEWTGTGRFVADPECNESKDDRPMAKFRIAVNRGRNEKGKDKGAYFFNCNAYDGIASAIAKYGAKGRAVLIRATLFLSRWDQEGEIRTAVGMTVRGFRFLDDKRPERSEEQENLAFGTADGYSRPAPTEEAEAPSVPF